MKIFFSLLVATLLLSSAIFAQDRIVKKDGREIKAKVSEITSDQVEYGNFDMANCPIHTINIKNVQKIVHENGSEEDFGETAKSQPAIQTTYYVSQYNQQEEETVGFMNANYFSLAVGTGNSYGGLGIRVQGRFGGKFGVGIHAGLGYFPSLGLGVNNGVELKSSVLASAGLKLFLYKSFYLNAQFGAFGYAEKSIYTSTYTYSSYYGYRYYYYSEKKDGLLYGPSALIGGDFIFGKHFGLNVALGVSYCMNKDFPQYEIWPAVDLGIMYRF